MIDAILRLFGYVIEFCYKLGGENYLVGLILFAIIVKIAMLPLSIKQQKNSIKQASLRPKEMAIRKKYAGRNDQPTQQKMQSEIMDLYQRENFNPMGGCLPLLIQLPILLGLYQVVIRPLEFLCHVPKDVVNAIMKSEEVVGQKITQQIELINYLKNNFSQFSAELQDYVSSAADLPNFDIFGVNLAEIPSLDKISILILVPVLTFIISYLSMKITKKFTYNANEGVQNDAAAGCSAKMMDWMMPIMSVYITFIVPAVIGIYWMFNSIFSTLQQIILAKVMPVPKFTEEDYKQAEKEMNGKSKNTKKSSEGSGEKKKVRSLHRIDEEDYVPEEPRKKKTEKQSGLAGMIEKPEMKDNSKKD